MDEVQKLIQRADDYRFALSSEHSNYLIKDLQAGLISLSRDLAAARRENAELRERTIEECARLAEGEVYKERYRKWPFSSGDWSRDGAIPQHCDKIAASIRAISVQPDPRKEESKPTAEELQHILDSKRDRTIEEIAQFIENEPIHSWVPRILAERIGALTKSSK